MVHDNHIAYDYLVGDRKYALSKETYLPPPHSVQFKAHAQYRFGV